MSSFKAVSTLRISWTFAPISVSYNYSAAAFNRNEIAAPAFEPGFRHIGRLPTPEAESAASASKPDLVSLAPISA
ncbi:MAG: hypothetical protein HQ546_05895 [Planctomycetes bacterium]|nr:hypothetical protein [Planctomycetota bacterium]